MDPITHTLSGIVIRQLGFKRKTALFVIILSAVAPDFDYVTRFWGIDVFLRYHRGITHGVLALMLFPALMSLLYGWRKKAFLYYYFISFLGYGSHLLMDLTNQYGTRILAPFDWNNYSLDLTFIIDPYITIGLLLSVIVGMTNKKRAALISFATVLLFSGYVLGRGYLQGQAREFLRTKIDANTYQVYPLPNDFLRWWFVTKSGDEVTTGFADLFTQRVYIQDKYRLANDAPEIIESKRADVVKSFLSFAGYPYAEVKREPDRAIVLWKELSYSFLPGERFTAKVVMDKKGKIIGSDFKF